MQMIFDLSNACYILQPAVRMEAQLQPGLSKFEINTEPQYTFGQEGSWQLCLHDASTCRFASHFDRTHYMRCFE